MRPRCKRKTRLLYSAAAGCPAYSSSETTCLSATTFRPFTCQSSRALLRLSSVEIYQDLIHPSLPPLPFGFVFAPHLENGSVSAALYIVPPEVLERRNVQAWHFDLKRWGNKPGGYGEYWFYVTKAEPWPLR